MNEADKLLKLSWEEVAQLPVIHTVEGYSLIHDDGDYRFWKSDTEEGKVILESNEEGNWVKLYEGDAATSSEIKASYHEFSALPDNVEKIMDNSYGNVLPFNSPFDSVLDNLGNIFFLGTDGFQSVIYRRNRIFL